MRRHSQVHQLHHLRMRLQLRNADEITSVPKNNFLCLGRGKGYARPLPSDNLGTDLMTPYPTEVELAMVTFYGSLREKDRRRYAAVEAAKLGPGGLAYLSHLLGIDSKTIRQGEADLKELPAVPPERVRKKGADGNGR
jgi:hypothetical protein